MSGAPLESLAGRVLKGAYRLEELIGEGGMGGVFRAVQLAVNRPVAVKIVRSDPNAPAEYISHLNERFEREALATSRLSHPNTVRLFDFGQSEDNLHFLVLELLQGRSLDSVLAEEGDVEPIRVAHIGRQIAKSLAEAHSKDIIHRDLKPDNVFLCEFDDDADFVKVMDFGIAAVRGPSWEEAKRMTAEATVLGSPCYMSPEQADARDVTVATDLYSLGIVMYEMLTGRVPFDGDSPIEVAIKHISEPVPPFHLPEQPKGVFEAWNGLLGRLLAKDPADRPATASDVADELRLIREMMRSSSHLSEPDAYMTKTMNVAGVEAALRELGVDPETLDAIREGSTIARLPTGPSTRNDAPLERSSRKTGLMIAAAALVFLAVGVAVGFFLLGQRDGAAREARTGPDPAAPEVASRSPEAGVAAPTEAPEDAASGPSEGALDATAAGSEDAAVGAAIDDVAAEEAADAGPDAAASDPPDGVTDLATPGDAAPVEAGPPPDRARLVLTTDPSGASVYRGRKRICNTPCREDLKPGKRTESLSIRHRGYKRVTIKVHLTAGETVELTKKLPRKRKKRRK